MTAVARAEVQTLFRCHLELELAVKRCPGCDASPCKCAKGYSGNVCNACIDGYGMSSSTRTCEPCEGTGYNTESLGILAAIVVGVVIVILIIGKFWKAFPLKVRHPAGRRIPHGCGTVTHTL